MSATLFTLSGPPLGRIWTYAAGTSTPLATFTDATGLVSAANPVLLDAYGDGYLWLGLGRTYKITVEDATGAVHGVVQPGWPVDGVSNYDAQAALASAIGEIQTNEQRQLSTAFVASGTAPNYTITAVPAIAAYSNGQEFEVTFHANGTDGANTLNVCGLGAKNLKQYSSTGAKLPSKVTSGFISRVRYDGIDFIVTNPLPTPGGKHVFYSSSTAHVAAPVSQQMSGYGSSFKFTPHGSGTVLVNFSGYVSCAIVEQAYLVIRYGTGTPPAEHAAATGTTGQIQAVYCTVANSLCPWAITGLMKNLTPGVEYWIDLQLDNSTLTGAQKTILANYGLAVELYGEVVGTGVTPSVTPIVGVEVALSPVVCGLTGGGTQVFTASVTGTSNAGLTWTVDGVWNGNATTGALTGTGVSRTYTAPSVAGIHAIRATSIADPGAVASASVVVSAAPVVAVYMAPATLFGIATGGTTTVTATVTGNANTAVAWTVDGVANGNSTVGTITGTGNTRTYTAPASAGAHTITATSVADGTKSASVVATSATAPVVGIVVYSGGTVATEKAVFTGGAQDLTVSVDAPVGFSTGFTVTVNGVPNGNAAVGVITAPSATVRTYTAPSIAGTNVVTFTSVADPAVSVSVSMVVSLQVPVVLSINPTGPTTIAPGVDLQLSASLSGMEPGWLTEWYVDDIRRGNSTVGVLTENGNAATYTTPASGNHTIRCEVSAVYRTQPGTYSATHGIVVQAAAAPAFLGYSANVTGGTGGSTVHVTNLNSTGAGSFAAVAAVADNQLIVFDVGGTINLTTEVSIRSNTTVDGTSAPSTGVTFTGRGIAIRTGVHDIVLKNFRHRGGYNGAGEKDNLTIMEDCYSIVLKNLSLSNAYDEALGIWDNNHDITIQDCIIGDGNVSGERYGSLCSNYNRRVTYARNLFHGNYYRLPAIGYDVSDVVAAPDITADIVNNIVWKYETRGTTIYHGGKANVRNNYYYTTVHPGVSGRAVNIETLGQAYCSGNYSRDGASTAGNAGAPFSVDSYAQITAMSAADAFTYVKANAGCRVGGLDATDTAILADVV